MGDESVKYISTDRSKSAEVPRADVLLAETVQLGDLGVYNKKQWLSVATYEANKNGWKFERTCAGSAVVVEAMFAAVRYAAQYTKKQPASVAVWWAF